MWDIKLKLISTDNSMFATIGKGAKHMVMEDDFILDSGHTMQYTDDVS